MADSYFRRGSDRLHCLQDQDRAGFTLTLRTPGGASLTQRFTDAASLAQHRMVLERTLRAAGWSAEAPARRRR